MHKDKQFRWPTWNEPLHNNLCRTANTWMWFFYYVTISHSLQLSIGLNHNLTTSISNASQHTCYSFIHTYTPLFPSTIHCFLLNCPKKRRECTVIKIYIERSRCTLLASTSKIQPRLCKEQTRSEARFKGSDNLTRDQFNSQVSCSVKLYLPSLMHLRKEGAEMGICFTIRNSHACLG